MAKYTSTFRGKGILNAEALTLVDSDRDSEKVYDLQAQLENYDGREVVITIKEDVDIEPMEEL